MSALRVPVSEKDHYTGDAQAKNVLVEYGDYPGKKWIVIMKLMDRWLSC